MNFARIHAVPVCIRIGANTGNIVEQIFSNYVAKFFREFISVRIHADPVFAPARIQAKLLANY